MFEDGHRHPVEKGAPSTGTDVQPLTLHGQASGRKDTAITLKRPISSILRRLSAIRFSRCSSYSHSAILESRAELDPLHWQGRCYREVLDSDKILDAESPTG